MKLTDTECKSYNFIRMLVCCHPERCLVKLWRIQSKQVVWCVPTACAGRAGPGLVLTQFYLGCPLPTSTATITSRHYHGHFQTEYRTKSKATMYRVSQKKSSSSLLLQQATGTFFLGHPVCISLLRNVMKVLLHI